MEIKWIKSLLQLLSGQSGENGPEDEEESEGETEETEEGDTGDDEEEGEEASSEENDEEESEEEDGDDDSGNNGGKKRSDTIPRKRFDQVNAKAKQVDRLLELGIIVEDEDGELHINQKAISKGKEAETNDEGKGKEKDFYFTKDEVDEASWPLVEKINKGFKHYDNMVNRATFSIIQLQSENAILKDFPEFLQKESPLRKKAMDIIKNDPEFKRNYKGHPEAGYWAVKRAAELLKGKVATLPKKKIKSKFIIGKGDKGAGGLKKAVDFSKMTKQQLDDLERKEHQQLNGNKNRK